MKFFLAKARNLEKLLHCFLGAGGQESVLKGKASPQKGSSDAIGKTKNNFSSDITTGFEPGCLLHIHIVGD